MKVIPVKSSTIHSVGYSPGPMTLAVTFKNKEGIPTSSYEYYQVPPEEVCNVLFADSVGSAFGKQIKKGDYVYKKLETIILPEVEEPAPIGLVIDRSVQ